MSDHRCEVVKITLRPHPKADRLSLVSVGGWECAVRTVDWQDGDLGAFVIPDSLVDTRREEFAFLANWPGKSRADGWARITAQKLRGVVSYGLLVKAPGGLQEGNDAAEALGIVHYEPTEPGHSGPGGSVSPGDSERGPDVRIYDVENLQKQLEDWDPEEPVQVTEKIHGANFRALWDGKRFWVGSRRQWKRRRPKARGWWARVKESLQEWWGVELATTSSWWKVFEMYPGLARMLRAHRELVVYGELVGCQDLRYGLAPNQLDLVVFEIMDAYGRVLDSPQTRWMLSIADTPMVPILWEGKFKSLSWWTYAQGPTVYGKDAHLREGIVIRSQRDPGKVAKVINPEYLVRN